MSARQNSVASITARITSAINAANGRRRERTVTYADAVQAIREALRDGYGYVNGGTVANAYKYPAWQTQVTAIAAEQAVIVRCLTGSAKKGSGTGLPWRRNASDEQIKNTILEHVWCPARNGEIRLSRRQARAIVAAQDHVDAVDAIERIPAELRECETLVTAADSLATGNCESETARVQSWFPGRGAVPAKELLAAIVQRAPSLIPFAVRAIQYAQRRTVAA